MTKQDNQTDRNSLAIALERLAEVVIELIEKEDVSELLDEVA